MSIYFYEFTLSHHAPNIALLSSAELSRCQSYLRPEPMKIFATGRTLLRQVLAQWLRMPAQNVPILIGKYGKPETEGIHFNLSYSHNKMILALSFNGPVGVDIEKIDRPICLEEMEACLSVREKENLSGIPESKKHLQFFTFWVKKEAALKELGTGIYTELAKIDTLDPDGHCIWTPVPIEDLYVCYLATSYEVTHVSRRFLEHNS